MNRVVDASVVVGALVDAGRYGAWWRELPAAGGLAAHHLPAEVTNLLRRGGASGRISAEAANLARAAGTADGRSARPANLRRYVVGRSQRPGAVPLEPPP